jgi:hypothetical protein
VRIAFAEFSLYILFDTYGKGVMKQVMMRELREPLSLFSFLIWGCVLFKKTVEHKLGGRFIHKYQIRYLWVFFLLLFSGVFFISILFDTYGVLVIYCFTAF